MGTPAWAHTAAPPSSTVPNAESDSPLQMTAGMPAAVAISAATTFERMPPVPSEDVSWLIASAALPAGSAVVANSPVISTLKRLDTSGTAQRPRCRPEPGRRSPPQASSCGR